MIVKKLKDDLMFVQDVKKDIIIVHLQNINMMLVLHKTMLIII